MKRLLPILLLLAASASAQNIDVAKYHLTLWVGLANDSLGGYADVELESKVNGLTTVDLDLYKFTVDSVKIGNTHRSYTYERDTALHINIPALNAGQRTTIRIYYHGYRTNEFLDPAEFGGFYNMGDYAIAVGLSGSGQLNRVSFASSWYPCVDDFNDKAIFEYHVSVDQQYVAVCNGTEMSNTVNGNIRTHHFVMNDTIAPYLANLIAGPLVVTNDTYNSLVGTIPVRIYTTLADQGKIPGTVANLDNILNIFENHFGPYAWSHVGLTWCPIQGFALENPTNIMMPGPTLSGNTTYEDLMAHELAHQWFGNLIGSTTPFSMWIKEGFARWSETLFFENRYGATAARNHMEESHHKALGFAHINDLGYHAIGNVPMNAIYGTHTYEKGATVVHTLRYQMGDDKYFTAIKNLFSSQYRWHNVSNNSLRDYLSMDSGVDLTDFFAKWIEQPGWVVLMQDSVKVVQNGANYNVTVAVGQELHKKTDRGNNLLLEVGFVRPTNFSILLDTIIVSGAHSEQTFTLDFNPVHVVLDPNARLLDGTLNSRKVAKTTGNHSMGNTGLTMNIASFADSVAIASRFHYARKGEVPAGADSLILGGTFWHVDVKPKSTASYSLVFNYNYAATINGRDYAWMQNIWPHLRAENRLRLVYRPHAGADWQPVTNVTYTLGSMNDQTGTIRANSNPPSGDYAFAILDWPTGREEAENRYASLKVYPNPTAHTLNIEIGAAYGASAWRVTDMSGRLLATYPGLPDQIATSDLANGLYLLQAVDTGGRTVAATRFQVMK